ncbi:MAG: MBL fold metallo-hydrolase [Proteobacteria bacterium]|nr:MBL fold metallo-hydrolase [Pseudomonadota bacterium]
MSRLTCFVFVAILAWASPLKAQDILNAARSGDLERVKKLLLKKPGLAETKSDNLKSPMHYSAQNGHLKIVELLYENGGSVTTPNISGETPLHYAAAGGFTAVMEFLIKKGADVNSRSTGRMTPLHYAVMLGNRKAAQLLIKKKCKLSLKDEYDMTPLDAAIEAQQNRIVKLLKKYGAQETQILDPEVTELATNVYGISFKNTGKPNVCLFVGKEGLMLVDTGYLRTMKKLKKAIVKINKGKIKYIINTHLHVDHISGNSLGGRHAQVINWDTLKKQTSSRLLRQAGTPLKGRSGESFDTYYTMTFNGEKIRLIPAAGAHTDKDIIIHFTKSKVVLMGDLLIPQSFPSVTSAVDRYLSILSKVIEFFPEDTMFMGGHARNVTMQELREYKQMLESSAAIVRKHIRTGKNLEEIRKIDVLKKYNQYNHFIKELNGNYWINAVYRQYIEKLPHTQKTKAPGPIK